MTEKALVLAAIIGPVYMVFGLSFLFYAKQWKRVVAEYAKNHFLMMLNMLIALVLGLIVINMYNVWAWDLGLVITLTGWAAIVKGVFYFLAPESFIKWALKCKLYQSEGFLLFWGLVMLALGALLSYNAYMI